MEPTRDELIRRFQDLRDGREHSHVDANMFQKICDIVHAVVEGSETRVTSTGLIAHRIVEELSDSEKALIVSDWLEGREHLGSF